MALSSHQMDVEASLAHTPSERLSKPLLENSAHGDASPWQVGINLTTCLFGVGIFSLPWSTAGASIIPSAVIVIFVMWLCAWTCTLVVEAGDQHDTFDLGSILAKLPRGMGPFAQMICNVFVWLSLYFLLVGYMKLMVDAALPFVVGTILDNPVYLVMLFSFLVLPLCFLDQRYLSFTSFLAVIITIYIFAVMVIDVSPNISDRTSYSSVCLLGFGTGNIAMFSAMTQAVAIQMCVLPMYEELKDRSPKKFRKLATMSFGFTSLFFVAFSVLGYFLFGPTVSSNVIKNMPATIAGSIARLGSILCAAAVYPIMAQSMVAPVRAIAGPEAASWTTGAFVVLTAGGALGFKHLGTLNVINGAMTCGAFIAICPSLIGLFLLKKSCSRGWRASMLALLLLGLFAAVLGLLYTDNYASEVNNSCLWKL